MFCFSEFSSQNQQVQEWNQGNQTSYSSALAPTGELPDQKGYLVPPVSSESTLVVCTQSNMHEKSKSSTLRSSKIMAEVPKTSNTEPRRVWSSWLYSWSCFSVINHVLWPKVRVRKLKNPELAFLAYPLIYQCGPELCLYSCRECLDPFVHTKATHKHC